MALSAADRDTIELWSGPITSAEMVDLDDATSRLGSAYATALQRLLKKRAAISVGPGTYGSADDQLSYVETVGWVEAQIGKLVGTIDADSSIVLSGAAEKVLDAAKAESSLATTTIDLLVPVQRRS